ncbi:MAG: phosphate ABC transporter permease PstA [bacterium]|nr:phosphate ABC transporter permease PstA [bacterium]
MRYVADFISTWLIRATAYSVVAVLIAIIGYIFVRGMSVINWEFITKPPIHGMTEGGISVCIYGTLALLAVTIGISMPLGVSAALYINEYQGAGLLRRLVRAAVNNLAGIPSIVFGLFGLGFFVILLNIGASLLAASLTLSVMILPIIIVATEEALKGIPIYFRTASYALGATRWQTVSRVVLPAAWPGIITGMVLSVGRVAGETAPILFTGAAFYLPYVPDNPLKQFMELSYHIFAMATQSSDVSATMPIAFGTTIILLALVFSVNLSGIIFRARERTRRGNW